jgi:hypothetical protein
LNKFKLDHIPRISTHNTFADCCSIRSASLDIVAIDCPRTRIITAKLTRCKDTFQGIVGISKKTNSTGIIFLPESGWWSRWNSRLRKSDGGREGSETLVGSKLRVESESH